MELTKTIKNKFMKILPALVVAVGAFSAVKPACAWFFHQPEMPSKLQDK